MKQKIERYLKEHRVVSKAELMAEFLLSHAELMPYLYELAHEGKVKQEGDNDVKYVIRKQTLCDLEDEQREIIVENQENDHDEELHDVLEELEQDADGEDDMDEQEDKDCEITLDNLYSSDFDMQGTIAKIPYMDKQVAHAISNPGRRDISSSWGGEAAFENVCMDVIELIVRKDPKWGRGEAITEAAKELIAVRFAKQRKEAEEVHIRVLHEFLISTPDEYRRLRDQLFGE